MSNYYTKQIDKLSGDIRLKLVSETGETNWINLNLESAIAIEQLTAKTLTECVQGISGRQLLSYNNCADTPVVWERAGDTHIVTYGKQVSYFGNDMDACHEYGECVRHSLECLSKFD